MIRIQFVLGLVMLSIIALLFIPSSENIIEATIDDKSSGIIIEFCGHNKNKLTLEECNDTIDGYSWGSKINVLIFAPAWNSEKNKIDTLGDDDIFRIGAYSDTSRQKGPCKFVETDVNSGLFAGRLKLNGFPHDSHGTGVKYLWGSKDCNSVKGPLHEAIKIGAGGGSSGGSFTVFWQYDHDKTITKTGHYEWREGTIEFDKNYYQLDDTVKVTLHDIDLEVFPYDLSTMRLKVWSDSDTRGITLTSSYKNGAHAGVSADFRLTNDKESRNDHRLRVSPGDTIYAQYTDHTLPRPYSNNDHKEIFAEAYVRDDFGKPIVFDSVDINKPVSYLGSKYELKSMITTLIKTKNTYTENLEVYFIFQIKDEQDRAIHIDWVRGIAPHEKTLMINHSFNELDSGKYTIEIFVFNNMEKLTPYSEVFQTEIII